MFNKRFVSILLLSVCMLLLLLLRCHDTRRFLIVFFFRFIKTAELATLDGSRPQSIKLTRENDSNVTGQMMNDQDSMIR